MSAIGGVSGNNGNAKIGSTDITELTKWNFKPKVVISKWGSNTTNGYKNAVAGTKDGNGTLEGKWDPGAVVLSQIDVATVVTLLLITFAGQQYTVPAIVSDFSL